MHIRVDILLRLPAATSHTVALFRAMEMDVNLRKAGGIELMTISAGSYSNNNKFYNNNTAPSFALRPVAPGTPPPRRIGCCGILSRLLCSGAAGTAKTASSSSDYNNLNSLRPNGGNHHALHVNVPATPSAGAIVSAVCNSGHTRRPQLRRTPQEIYFESRGKSCKKLLKFNGYSNKVSQRQNMFLFFEL